MQVIFFYILLIGAYCLGSCSSAIWVCRWKKLPDPRTQGSGNPGATNVLRIGGKRVALYVLAADMLKGFVPVLVAHIFQMKGMALGFIALAAILGHIFPLYYRFQGGKGVATALGTLIALSPTLACIVMIVWAVVIVVTRYVSLASIIAAASAPALAPFISGLDDFIPLALTAIVVILRHMSNVERLMAGCEPKLGQKKVEENT